MKKNIKLLILTFFIATLFSFTTSADEAEEYAKAFKSARHQTCDSVFTKLEDDCRDMICRDLLVNALAECWKKSMNSELDKRLLPLKQSNPAAFYKEMDLQKAFNQATQKACGKVCKNGQSMKGISYNFCRKDAYKYRASQGTQILKQALSIPTTGKISLKKSNKKNKETMSYLDFIKQLCALPNTVWQDNQAPLDCQNKGLQELNEYEFTDDPCNLS